MELPGRDGPLRGALDGWSTHDLHASKSAAPLDLSKIRRSLRGGRVGMSNPAADALGQLDLEGRVSTTLMPHALLTSMQMSNKATE